VLEELLDVGCLVRQQVIEKDVDFLIGRASGDDVTQKADEFAAGVARRGFAPDGSC
jgi:hypothetical protein